MSEILRSRFEIVRLAKQWEYWSKRNASSLPKARSSASYFDKVYIVIACILSWCLELASNRDEILNAELTVASIGVTFLLNGVGEALGRAIPQRNWCFNVVLFNMVFRVDLALLVFQAVLPYVLTIAIVCFALSWFIYRGKPVKIRQRSLLLLRLGERVKWHSAMIVAMLAVDTIFLNVEAQLEHLTYINMGFTMFGAAIEIDIYGTRYRQLTTLPRRRHPIGTESRWRRITRYLKNLWYRLLRN